jgi:hypothetical protein
LCEGRFCKKKFLVRERIPLSARSHRFFGNTLLKAGHRAVERCIGTVRGRVDKVIE